MGFEWLALTLYYLRAPVYFSGEYPVSYFATLPETRIIFSICYLGAAVCFWIFVNHHLKNHYKTPLKIFAYSMVTFAAVALIPYNPDSALSLLVHNVLVQSSFVAFWLGMFLLGKHSQDRRFKIISYAATLLSFGLMLGFVLVPEASRLTLFFELSSWLVCQLWIIWLSIRAYKKAYV